MRQRLRQSRSLISPPTRPLLSHLTTRITPRPIKSSPFATLVPPHPRIITAPGPWNGLDLSGGHGRGDGEEDESFHPLASLKVVQRPAGAVIRCLLMHLYSMPLQLSPNRLSFQGPCLALAALHQHPQEYNKLRRPYVVVVLSDSSLQNTRQDGSQTRPVRDTRAQLTPHLADHNDPLSSSNEDGDTSSFEPGRIWAYPYKHPTCPYYGKT